MKRKTFMTVMDPRDNSVVLPPDFIEHVGGLDRCEKVYVTRISGVEEKYAFVLNPNFDEETQIAEVQYNTQTRNYGFESLIPSVVLMFARWGFDLETPMKVPVRELRTNYDFGNLYVFQEKDAEEA